MAQQPFKTDKTSNIIEKSPEGDMVFRDSFVEGVTLTQLLGGDITLAPAIVVNIEETDWNEIIVDGQTRYRVEIPHPWDDLCDPKVEVNIWKDDIEITLNKVQFSQTRILLESTVIINIQVVLKRL